MTTQKAKRRASELLPRYGAVTDARISMHIYAHKERGKLRERSSSVSIEVIGRFTEAVGEITQFSILVLPVLRPTLGQAETPSVGSFSQFKPIARGVVELSFDEFQHLMLLSTSGSLQSCYFAFNEPYRGRALIVSISFSSGPPEE